MVKVKICGIRREKDVEFINKYKPDYIGFVFAKSKRQVDVNTARELGKKIDRGIKKVGVFVNEDVEIVKKIAVCANLDIIQLHGDEDEAYIKKLDGFTIWKAVSINSEEDISEFKNYSAAGFLVDSSDGSNRGGTGKTFNWNFLKTMENQISKPIIAAGGLNIDNVEKCIRTLSPFAVDVSSGVETDGFKDEEKIKNFIMRVRNFK